MLHPKTCLHTHKGEKNGGKGIGAAPLGKREQYLFVATIYALWAEEEQSSLKSVF